MNTIQNGHCRLLDDLVPRRERWRDRPRPRTAAPIGNPAFPPLLVFPPRHCVRARRAHNADRKHVLRHLGC